MAPGERTDEEIINAQLLEQTRALLDAFLVATSPEFANNPEWLSWLEHWTPKLRVWFLAMKKGQVEAGTRN